jgi:hypothetical protein
VTRGQEILVQGWQITPLEQRVQMRWPGGGLVRRRIQAIEVHRGDHTSVLPVTPVAQRAIPFLIAGLGIITLATVSIQEIRLKKRRVQP